MVKIMYAQQYRQPPKDYGGTAIQPKEQNKEPEEPEASPAPPRLLSSVGTDEILIAVIVFMVISGGWEKNALVIMALIFILL